MGSGRIRPKRIKHPAISPVTQTISKSVFQVSIEKNEL